MNTSTALWVIAIATGIWWGYVLSARDSKTFEKYWLLHTLAVLTVAFGTYRLDPDFDNWHMTPVFLIWIFMDCCYAKGRASVRKKPQIIVCGCGGVKKP